MKFKHQGDINFTPYSGEIKGKKQNHNGSFVLALGEHSGHKHVITADPDSMEIYKDGDTFFITLKTEGEISHNQHGAITLAAGTYKMGYEREVDWFAEGIERQVID